jgi:hypothetical protein
MQLFSNRHATVQQPPCNYSATTMQLFSYHHAPVQQPPCTCACSSGLVAIFGSLSRGSYYCNTRLLVYLTKDLLDNDASSSGVNAGTHVLIHLCICLNVRDVGLNAYFALNQTELKEGCGFHIDVNVSSNGGWASTLLLKPLTATGTRAGAKCLADMMCANHTLHHKWVFWHWAVICHLLGWRPF